MALTKLIDFGNGVVSKTAYIIVSKIIAIDYKCKSIDFTVETYLNKDCFDKGLKTMIEPENFHVSDADGVWPRTDGSVPPPVPTPETSEELLFTKYFASGDQRVNAENYILLFDKYKDCVPA
jgi:hypothetical protein